MKVLPDITRLLSLLLPAVFGVAAQAAEGEWVTLIDGTDGMDNFNIVGDANWSAQQSAIQATEGSGASWLVTRRSFDDFVLRVEFWASHDANSGVYLRCQDPSRITDRNCYEANIYDERPDPAYGTGAIVHIAPIAEPRPRVGDQWNVYKITLRGDHLLVELNGDKTVDVRDSQFSSGPFALQWGRGTLRFRKVEIMEL